MFQTWLGSFRRYRVQQTPAQQQTFSSKEQVDHKLVWLLGDSVVLRTSMEYRLPAILAFGQQRLIKHIVFTALTHKNTCHFNPHFLTPVTNQLAMCFTWTLWKPSHWRGPRQFPRRPSVLWLWIHVLRQRLSTSKCPLKASL